MKTPRVFVAALAALLAAGISAYAAGMWAGFPAATSITGNETIPADTNLASGVSPQTELITTSQLAGYMADRVAQPRNALIGGDFGTNPWARGTASGDIANTLTYQADRWWNLGAAGSAINVNIESGASDITAGFLSSLRFQRKAANADANQICMGQALTTQNSMAFQGKTVAFSFYMKLGANFSGASSLVKPTIGYGTGSDQSAANFALAAWTGYTAAYSTSITATTAWVRYTVTAVIPATATQLGVSLCYTPVGAAGANDWFEVNGIQLETIPTGTTTASPYDFENAGLTRLKAQRFAWVLSEAGSGVVQATCQDNTTTVALCFLPNPVIMRAAPSDTVTTGTWAITKADGTAQTGTVTNTGTNTSGAIVFTMTAGAANLIAGNIGQLIGAGGTGTIVVSAEL